MKKQRNLVPTTEVLAWLAANFPDLHKVAEIERSWVWLPVDLSGEANKPIREAIGGNGYGFRYAKRGHPLPSGKVGTWAHCGTRPLPFRRRGGGEGHNGGSGPSRTQDEALEREIAAILGMVGGRNSDNQWVSRQAVRA